MSWPADPFPPGHGARDTAPVRSAVLIVDDDASFRTVARALLEQEGYTIVGEAADGAEAIRENARLRADLVLVDIQLPDMDGFTVASAVAAHPDAPDVVLISSRGADAYRGRLAVSPARGFIPKADLSRSAIEHLVG